MKIQIFSDLHMEAYNSDPAFLWKFITPQAPVAVVAGDIDAREFEKTVTEIASKFEKVVVLLGNHEYYRKDISWKPDLTKIPSNVYVLNPGICEIEDVTFIGATLWTDFDREDHWTKQSAAYHINDFYIISNGEDKKFHPNDALEIHYRERAYIEKMIELNRDKKIVVVTHFMPSLKLVRKKWGDTMVNRYFSAGCDELIAKSEAAMWVFGHTHDFIDEELHGVKCVCNPLGYPRENPLYEDLIIDV